MKSVKRWEVTMEITVLRNVHIKMKRVCKR